jgi:hypothetical protein
MHEETISPACLRLISDLANCTFLKDFYLVGGTALALQLGHRKSIDLDFFSQREFTPYEWQPTISKLGDLTDLEMRSNNLSCYINSVKLEFLYFAYPNHFPLIEWNGIKMLSPMDIAMFKILAIIGRNRKKDIVDLYFINEKVADLEEVISNFIKNFAPGDVNFLKQIELLFDDKAVEQSEMPEMLAEIDWQDAYELVKERVSNAVRKQLL